MVEDCHAGLVSSVKTSVAAVVGLVDEGKEAAKLGNEEALEKLSGHENTTKVSESCRGLFYRIWGFLGIV